MFSGDSDYTSEIRFYFLLSVFSLDPRQVEPQVLLQVVSSFLGFRLLKKSGESRFPISLFFSRIANEHATKFNRSLRRPRSAPSYLVFCRGRMWPTLAQGARTLARRINFCHLMHRVNVPPMPRATHPHHACHCYGTGQTPGGLGVTGLKTEPTLWTRNERSAEPTSTGSTGRAPSTPQTR